MTRGGARRALVVVACSALAPAARANDEPFEGTGTHAADHSKDLGIHTPRGRALYRSDATVEAAVDSRRRIFVIEAVAGAGPEGNLGLVFGWMPKAVKGLEFYGGAGFEWNPAAHVSGAVRYLFNVRGHRPYVALGYFYKDLYEIDTYAHNAFLEVGYSLKLGPTNHLSIGAGLARLVAAGVRADSDLRTADVEPASIDAELAAIPRYLPLAAARFSRAF